MKFAWSGWWRRRALGATTASLVTITSVACGGGPKPQPLSAEAALAQNAAGTDAAPVPAPPGVIAVGRARDYRQWVKLEQASPVVAYLKKKLVEEEGDALLDDWDLTQPIEFVAAFDPNFQRTKDLPAPPAKPDADAGAESEDDDALEAKSEGAEGESSDSIESHLLAAISLPLTRYAPESYEGLGFKHWTSNAYVRGKCLVTPALGGAKARLICGDHPDVTRHLYGYLARGLPLEALSASPLFVEIRPRPLKGLWEPSRKASLESLHALAASGGDTSHLLEQLMLDVVKEIDAWVASAETLRFEGGPNQRGEFEANTTLALRSPQPWLVESSLASKAKITGAPSAFLNLPKDVDAAWYSYGMPAERTAVVQSAVVNLAKTALREYGSVSSIDSVHLRVKEAKTVDWLVDQLISALDSPCLRAEQAVVANMPADPSELDAYTKPKKVKIVKSPQRAPMVPLDVLARATLGQYLLAWPNGAHCSQFTEQWVEMLTTLLQALPPKERKEFPLSSSVRKNVKLNGLPPATVTRFSLTKQAVTQLIKEFKSEGAGKRYDDYKVDTAGSPLNRWGAPQGPMVLSLIAVPAADATGSDWLAVGLDEKQLVQALVQATHPVPGQTLAARAELAPFIAQNPNSLSFQSFEAQSRLLALLGGPEFGPALAGLQGLFHGTNVVSTTHVELRGNVAQAGVSYYLSKEGLGAVRQILSWDIERILEIAKTIDKMDSATKAESNGK